MFSSPRPSWSLRTRLIAALVGLLAVVCVVVGVATAAAVYQVRVNQFDAQLSGAADRARGPRSDAAQDPADGHRGPGGPLGAGQVPYTVLGHITKNVGLDDARLLGEDASTSTQLTDAQRAALRTVPVDRTAHTRALGDLGDYRLIARYAHSGDGDILITGLPMHDVYTSLYELVAVEAVASLGALLLAGLLGAAIVGRTLRPLDRVAATAARVTELPLDRGEVALSERVPDIDTDPRTEVGQVGAALNRMLGHVAHALAARQASEMRVRHFVADASHELRTPLAAIRGYAELTRRGRDTVPPDVAHAMSRVESESARMTVLVEDLLLLARLDSGRPLESGPVDLSRLAIDAVSDAHVAGPDHRWQLDLPEESVTVAGDPARLHQVLANLLANGRTHTPPGTTVTTRLRVDGAYAGLSVVDNGPGIPAGLLPEVFDRFARGDNSRSRQAGSTGLGLAIVAAVVEAHGGDVGVTSEPGRTEFTVRLPTFADVPAGNGVLN